MTLSIETKNPFNIDVTHCDRWMPSIDADDINTCQNNFDIYQNNIEFFKEFQQINNLPKDHQFFMEFNDFELFFHLSEANFTFKLKGSSKNIFWLDKEILSKTESPFILHPEIGKNDQDLSFPFRFGTTLEQIIEINRKTRILDEKDKILISIQITTAIRDLYEQNKEKSNYLNRRISDRSFFIDYMKNAYLFTISDDKMINLIEENDITDQKAKDIHILKCLLEEIFKENPSDGLKSNQGYIWYANKHECLNNILNKKHDDFDAIIKDLRNLPFFKEDINERLNYAEKNSQVLSTRCSFPESIISKLSINLDINLIYRQLFMQLRDAAKEKDQYYLFFNLITHIFFPTINTNCFSFDNSKLFEIFNKSKSISDLITYNLLEKYLPENKEFQNALFRLERDLNENKSNEEEKELSNEDIELFINRLKSEELKSIIISELKQNPEDQTFLNFLKKVYFYYFPGNKVEYEKFTESQKEFIFDYFGIIYFITHKNDLIYITHPIISDKNLNRLHHFVSDQSINLFIKSKFPYSNSNKMINIAQSISGFDFANVSNKLMFKYDNSSFYIERRFKHEKSDFKQMVNNQDTVFTKIQSKKDEYDKKQLRTKYILQLDEKVNQMTSGDTGSNSNIPLFSCTLNHVIQNNSKNRIILDSDKILWAIQIAYAFATLEKFEEDEFKNKYLFSRSIYDQFFYIDSMKNIYLSALAFNIESDKESSTSNGPMYFRCDNDASYVYNYGILLFEIFAEIEPKNVFGNLSRQDRLVLLKKGYNAIELFRKYKERFSSIYGPEIGKIIDRCISIERNDKYQNFQEIIDDLKKTNLYEKYKYTIELREKEAKPIDSNYNCSFKSLLLSSITGLRDIKTILTEFYKSLNNLTDHEKTKQILTNCLSILDNKKPQECFFESVNKLASKRKFQGSIDLLLSEIISRQFYKFNGRKAVVINKSALNQFGCDITDMEHFNCMSKMVSEGITIDNSSDEYFFPDQNYLNLRNKSKVPILSLDYYLKGKCGTEYDNRINHWIYQIIYFLNKRNYVLSTKIDSYKIKLSDFALFYNNKTNQFDVDISPKSIYEITKKINVFSFAQILKQLKKAGGKDDTDYDDDDDDFESINQFISFCKNISYECYYQTESSLNFESKLSSGFFLYDLLTLFKKELKQNVEDEEQFKKTIDHSNYQDDNYKILYSNFKTYMKKLIPIKGSKPDLIGNEDASSGFYFFYERDSQELQKNDNEIISILQKIFPAENKSVIEQEVRRNKNISEIANKLIGNVQKMDEFTYHRNTNYKTKLFLIMKVLPDYDPIYIYKVFKLKNERIYDTLTYIFNQQNQIIDYLNFQYEMDINNLFFIFPEIMMQFIDNSIDEAQDMIQKSVLKHFDSIKPEPIRKVIGDMVIESTLGKEEEIDLRVQSTIAKLKEEIISEIQDIKNINNLSENQLEEVKKIKEMEINELEILQLNNSTSVIKTYINEDFYDIFKMLMDTIRSKALSQIIKYYNAKNHNFVETTKSIADKILRKDKQKVGSVGNYANQAIEKYKKPSFDKEVQRYLKIFGDMTKRGYKNLIKRYINCLNPKYNYCLIINIQNYKTDISNDNKLNDVEEFVRSLGIPVEKFSGGLKLTIAKKI